ncbi:hypothetical protein SS1G_02359 [Sclerotinia sclerotiorum 1980 UF-70]|uniref:Indole-diterpene biosynthesis protein PaxU n=2 Tax=Sclerotinia sclerotiorum (strain ATCC 18683 / 1980 / Ss-1) TaxID=665079 RepID=A7EAM7_SCLS1|nr:hypothetical protein SS1G_02359 [Sclerotinia sclerotiorum 1980 UF-70]APA08631.1 hypothetical protein sscle_04g034010 [Sclerotinia sclerotiorum 1980 UF-70]EDN99505.1 hypothetical protein SS1G_02359 [Sclerotinia sclerotiorum 1980 UF-70]
MSAKAPQRTTSALSFMEKISPHVYLFRPSLDNTRNGAKADDPALIVIFGWMNAPDGPLAKYIRQYQAIFPGSAILLITCTFAGMTVPWLGLRESRIAATTIQAIMKQDEQQALSHRDSELHPRLLLHVFSNAGSTMLYHLYAAYSSDKNKSAILPLHATVFDSTPAPFTYQTLVRGILDGAPSPAIRIAVMPIAYLYVAFIWVIVTVLRIPDHIGDLAPRAHNDVACVNEACRVYIYGTDDRITPAAGVKRHADEAETRGYHVRHEVFNGSGHVAHAKKDADRYWRIVNETWEEAKLGKRMGPRL